MLKISPSKLKKILADHKLQFWSLFILLVLLGFYPFFQGKTLLFGDNYSLMVPAKVFTANWLKRGILPLWNPYLFSGISWISDVGQSVLHPSTLLFVLFRPAVALNLTVLLHLLLAYGGMYLLAREWLKDHAWALVASVLWAFSPQVIASLNNLSVMQSLTWLPLLSYLGLRLVKEKQFRGWFALAVLGQFLGGYPQHVLYGILLAVLLSGFKEFKQISWKKWFRPWLVAGLFTLGLTAIAWVPFVDVLSKSTRVMQTEAQSTAGSFHPAGLIEFIVPYFFDNPQAGVRWGPLWNDLSLAGLYATWLGWLAIVHSFFIKKKKVSREVWFFAVTLTVLLLLSFGQYLPGFALIQKIIPLLSITRLPGTLLGSGSVLLVLWTVRSLQSWSVSKSQRQWWLNIGSLIFVLSLVALWVNQNAFLWAWQTVDSFASSSLSQSSFHTAERDRLIMFEIVKNILYNSLFFITLFYIFTRKKLKNGLLILALIIGLAMLFNSRGQLFFAPRKSYETNNRLAAQLNKEINLPATAYQQRLLTRNANRPFTSYDSYWEALMVREPFSDSFVDQQELEDFDHAQALLIGQTPDWNLAFDTPVVNGYTTLLPQGYSALWHKGAEPRINSLNFIKPDSALLDQWAVKYYLVDTWFKIEENLSEWPVVAEVDRWQLRERPKALTRIRFKDGSPAELSGFQENPNQLSFTIENSDNQSSLLIADRFDKDWQIKINGQKRVITNHEGMRELQLDPGENEIQMWYAPKWFYVGLVTTALSMVSWVIYQRTED
jgi:hypothetical protein